MDPVPVGPASSVIEPDKWLILDVDDGKGEPFQKVFATWAGGYTTGDSWRLNSGIKNTIDDGDCWIFEGESGSKYRCHKKMQGVAGASNNYVLDTLLKKFKDQLTINNNDVLIK